jgi:hypothetical protein
MAYGLDARKSDCSIDFFVVFPALSDPDYFATVQVDPEIGTIGWPNGADLDPDVLYSMAIRYP